MVVIDMCALSVAGSANMLLFLPEGEADCGRAGGGGADFGDSVDMGE